MKPLIEPDLVSFDCELPEGRQFFRVPELARILGVSDRHVSNLVDSGELEVGVDLRSRATSRSCLRIPRSSVVRFLKSRRAL